MKIKMSDVTEQRVVEHIDTCSNHDQDGCNPPDSCFNCRYPDCRAYQKPTPKEKEFVKGAGN